MIHSQSMDNATQQPCQSDVVMVRHCTSRRNVTPAGINVPTRVFCNHPLFFFVFTTVKHCACDPI